MIHTKYFNMIPFISLIYLFLNQGKPFYQSSAKYNSIINAVIIPLL